MNIDETGVRGYLKWLQHDQPGIYKLAAPRIAQLVPGAFSNHEQSQAMGALMYDFSFSTPPLTDIGVTIPDESMDVANAADSGASSASIVSGISSIIDSITNAYQAKTSADISRQAAEAYKQLTQTQLQRAQLGISPLAVQSGQYGMPIISAPSAKSIASGAGIAVGALLLFGALAMLGKRR